MSKNRHILNYFEMKMSGKLQNDNIEHIESDIQKSVNLFVNNKNSHINLLYSYEIIDNTKKIITQSYNNKNIISNISHSTRVNQDHCENAETTNKLFECDTTSSPPTIVISRPIIAGGQQAGRILVRISIPFLLEHLFNNEQEGLHELVYLQHDNCHMFSSNAEYFELPDEFSTIQNTITRVATPHHLEEQLSHWSNESIAVKAPIMDSGFSIIALIPVETIFNSRTMPLAFLAATLSLLLLLGLALTMRLNTKKTFLQAQLDEKAKSETRLRKHMDEFNTLFNALPGYAWHMNAEGRLVTANAATCRFLGHPLEEMIGKTVHDIFPADLADVFQRDEAPLLSGECRSKVDELQIVWQGRAFDLATRIESIIADDGTVCGLLGLSRDVTQKRRTDKKLVRNTALQKMILDLAITLVNHPVTEMDAAILNALGMMGTFCDADRAYVFRYDYSMECAINTHEWNAHETCPRREPRRKLSQTMLAALVESHRNDRQVYIPDPESLPAGSAMRTNLLLMGINSFISLPIVHESRCSGFVGFESTRKDKTWDEEEISLLKIASHLLTNAEMRRVHELRLIEARTIAEEAYNIMEKKIEDRTQELITINQRLNSEISMRMQAIRDLQITLKAISAILIAIDNDDSVTQWSRAAELSFGLEGSRTIDKTFWHLPISWDWDVIGPAILQCRSDGDATKISNVKYVHTNGSDRFLVVTVTPLLDDVGAMTGCLLLGEDITEIKTLEAQLAQAARLEAIGQLAAGIAHEINTPIQYVGDSVTFLKESHKDLDRILEFAMSDCRQPFGDQNILSHLNLALENMDIEFIREETPRTFARIEQGLGKISSIVKAMNRFTHCDLSEQKTSNINEIIENAVTITQNVWKYSAEVEMDFEDEKLLIHCMHGEIGQAILNIIINAAHAIENVANGSKEKGLIHITTRKQKEYIEIRIKDTGTGIPAEIGNKIFNMFFTTKPIGRGTGQGLSLAYNTIVSKHKGTLTYESRLGHGTTFIITLPIDGTEKPERLLP